MEQNSNIEETAPPSKPKKKSYYVKKPRKYKYLSNHNLLIQLDLSHEQDRMTDELAKMVMLLVDNIGKKPNFNGYSYLDEMKHEAICNLMTAWRKFDRHRVCDQLNPFAFFTTCVTNSFKKVLNAEKKVRDIRDDMLEDAGMLPSMTRQQANEKAQEAIKNPEANT